MSQKQNNQESERAQLKNEILRVTAASFAEVALAVFRFQAKYNPLYAQFLALLGRSPEHITQLEAFPH